MAKKIAQILTVVAVVSLLGWVAWSFDSSSAQGREERAKDEVFSYQLPEDKESQSDVLIRCNEDVLNKSTEEFAKWKGLSGYPLSVPGGPLVIARLRDAELPEELKGFQRTIIEFLKRHSPRRVVLVGHTQCIHYDAIAAYADALAGIREQQVKDLNAAASLIKEWLPNSEVQAYLAENENRTLFFRPVH